MADEKYAEIARMLGYKFKTKEEGAAALVKGVRELMATLDMPATIAQFGVSKEAFEAKVKFLADKAFEDQCTTANPKMPLVTELEEIYRKAYSGE